MTLRVRLALALSLLTAIAVTAMALVGYRSTATRLYQEIDRSLNSSSTRFVDDRYASQVCGRLKANAPDDGNGGPVADLPGTAVQCLDGSGVRYAASSSEPLRIDPNDVLLAGRGTGSSIRTVADDRILTVGVRGGGAVQLSRELDEVRHVLANLRVRFAVIGASITMLAALVGWWIASRVTRPVTRLTAATEAIAESGRLDVDVPAGGSDETGRLAHSFAMMLDALRRSREQQQRLAQDAGHELRTPLTSLRTNVEVLRRHPELEPATRDRVLGDIDSELRELTVVTNELVALATEEADDEPTQAVDVDALARRAAARTQRRRRRTVVVDAEPWSVSGQPRQLLRVLDNLLDNAAKFDPSTAPIEVVVRPGTITVRDHGAGIDPTDQPRVFDRFYRAPSARAQPGSGLGLAIAGDVVRRHGGTISATNHRDGGAIITISLPIPDPGTAGSTTATAVTEAGGTAGSTTATAVTEAGGAAPMSHQTLT